ncbi:MAG: hypothetical protein IJN42_00165 [Clostridia bacterium]|nr:hypothetical protein [Clostridia bacterium]
MTLKEMNALRVSPLEEQIHLGTLRRLECMERDALALSDSPLRDGLLRQLRQQLAETTLQLHNLQHRKEQLQRVIDAAPDDYLRGILRGRYEEKLTWEEIALRLCGENSCSAKKRVQRFLETLP